jgi:hypothetical protein
MLSAAVSWPDRANARAQVELDLEVRAGVAVFRKKQPLQARDIPALLDSLIRVLPVEMKSTVLDEEEVRRP